MTPTKILIGQIIVVLAVVIGAVWGATRFGATSMVLEAGTGAREGTGKG